MYSNLQPLHMNDKWTVNYCYIIYNFISSNIWRFTIHIDKEYVMKQNLRQPTKQSSSFSSRVNLSFVLDIWHSFHPIREQIEALQLWNMIMLLLSTRQVTTSILQWHILKRRKRLRDDESNNNAVHSKQNGESEEFRSNFTD